jgi:hypothetical protein
MSLELANLVGDQYEVNSTTPMTSALSNGVRYTAAQRLGFIQKAIQQMDVAFRFNFLGLIQSAGSYQIPFKRDTLEVINQDSADLYDRALFLCAVYLFPNGQNAPPVYYRIVPDAVMDDYRNFGYSARDFYPSGEFQGRINITMGGAFGGSTSSFNSIATQYQSGEAFVVGFADRIIGINSSIDPNVAFLQVSQEAMRDMKSNRRLDFSLVQEHVIDTQVVASVQNGLITYPRGILYRTHILKVREIGIKLRTETIYRRCREVSIEQLRAHQTGDVPLLGLYKNRYSAIDTPLWAQDETGIYFFPEDVSKNVISDLKIDYTGLPDAVYFAKNKSDLQFFAPGYTGTFAGLSVSYIGKPPKVLVAASLDGRIDYYPSQRLKETSIPSPIFLEYIAKQPQLVYDSNGLTVVPSTAVGGVDLIYPSEFDEITLRLAHAQTLRNDNDEQYLIENKTAMDDLNRYLQLSSQRPLEPVAGMQAAQPKQATQENV